RSEAPAERRVETPLTREHRHPARNASRAPSLVEPVRNASRAPSRNAPPTMQRTELSEGRRKVISNTQEDSEIAVRPAETALRGEVNIMTVNGISYNDDAAAASARDGSVAAPAGADSAAFDPDAVIAGLSP